MLVAASSVCHFAFFENALVLTGGVLSAFLCSHIAYLSHVLLDVAARTELNNAVLADMLRKAKDPDLDRYWHLNAVYIETDRKR